MTIKVKVVVLAAAVAAAGAALFETWKESTSMAEATKPAAPSLPVEGPLPSLQGANEWLNGPPLTREALRGKVVVVEFWTYTCINWRRTLSHVRAWSEKYRDRGLVVIGVHTPEFSFERDIDNVRRATSEMMIGYPIAIDNDFAIWRAFRNAYWPATYIIDGQGQIRHHKFGEGGYEESETVIRQLLNVVGEERATVDAHGFEVEADWSSLQSPETYLGVERSENFDSPGGARLEKATLYEFPAQLRPNRWALSGSWTVAKEAISLNHAGGRIAYRFHARDLHLIMGPSARGASLRFRVLLDGKPPGKAHGLDVDDESNGTVTEQRMYQLIRQSKPIVDRLFEIEFLDAGVSAFDFTFG
jgi:thiol-disulfide isomerase/thioredoxin